jgi:1,2-diacylglycerol 3-beta-galactosyltransferase
MKKILLVYGSAGGGHKSTAYAIKESLEALYKNQVDVKTIDVLSKEYGPAITSTAPAIYKTLIKAPRSWELLYRITDTKAGNKVLDKVVSVISQAKADKLLETYQPDVIVSTYHFANSAILDYLNFAKLNIPFITVVTDIVTMMPTWFSKHADLTITPTEQAKELGLSLGLEEGKLKVIGQPISRKFNQEKLSRKAARKKLSLDQNLPTLMVMAGGEGVGPLEEIAELFEEFEHQVQLVLICGKNTKLKEKLEDRRWKQKVAVYGFTDQIPELMMASDYHLAKAGPSAIFESFACGLPLLLYAFIPGQEEGNVSFVTDEGAGFWVPTGKDILVSVRRWINHPDQYKAAAHAALQMAIPDASDEIAKTIFEFDA